MTTLDADTVARPEPPLAGDGTETLLGSLERQRAAFAWKVGEDPPARNPTWPAPGA